MIEQPTLTHTFRFTGLRWSILAVALATSAAVVGMVGFQVWHDRERVFDSARAETGSIATSLAEHAHQIFGTTDVLMRGLANDVDGLPSLDRIDRQKLHEKLSTVATGASFMHALAVIDASGRRIATADTATPGPISFDTQPHFFLQQFNPKLGLYIGSPIKGVAGRTEGEWLLPITRRIESRGGQFAGIVYAGLPVSYFLDFYKSLEINPRVSVRLFLSDGSLLVSESAALSGQTDFFWHPIFKDLLRTRPAGSFEGIGLDPFHGDEIVSYRTVPGFPLVVTVSMNRSEVLAPWRAQVKADGLFAIAMLLAIGGAATWLIRLTIQREKLLADVTTEKLRAEKASDEARRADRAKSTFLATMSHEIRTPMNGIIGFAELLLETPLDGRQREYLTTVHDSARTLLGLLNDILDYSKAEAGKIELESLDFDPSSIVRGVASLFHRQAEAKGLVVTVTLGPDVPPSVTGDPNRLRQILSNLINNAIKFTEHGSVGIEVSVAGRGMDWVGLRFAVKDTGIGIAEEARRNLFSHFSQADSSIARRFGGSGLGLAICKSLVELMGGEIGVVSRPGDGATFWFTISLPLTVAPAKKPAAAPPANAVGTGTVLVVDDVEINRRLVSVMLTSAGYHVEEASSGRGALDRMARGNIDIVLLDLQMPDMDGFESARRIRTLLGGTSKVIVLAMTANVMSGVVEECLRAGMNGYIRKPATKAELLAAIARHLRPDHLRPEGERREREPPPAAANIVERAFDPATLDELERHIGRDKVAECLRLLIAQTPPAIARLSAALKEGDFDAAEREAHALISPLGNLGLPAAAKRARQLTDGIRTKIASRAELAIEFELLARAYESGIAEAERRYLEEPARRAASA